MPQLDAFLKRDFFIENLSFHRARKFYSWMLSFLGKLTHGLQIDQKWLKCRIYWSKTNDWSDLCPPTWESTSPLSKTG